MKYTVRINPILAQINLSSLNKKMRPVIHLDDGHHSSNDTPNSIVEDIRCVMLFRCLIVSILCVSLAFVIFGVHAYYTF